MAITRQRLTLDQFLRLPEEEPDLEYWRGEVTQKVSPKGPHSAIQYGFIRRIADLPSLRRLVRVFPEARVIFGGSSLVPDLIVLRRERVPRDATGQVAEDFMLPPDVAIEIASPGQVRRNLLERCRWYVANGVPLAVFTDPRRRVVRLFRPDAETGDLSGTDLVNLTDVLPGFALTVEELFEPLAADWV